MFNPSPTIRVLPITPQHDCYVVDDALLEPERWVDYAVAHRAEFRLTGHNAFPGPEFRMPDAISADLDGFLAQHIRGLLGARRTVRMYSRLSLVTREPRALEPRQWICHRDRFDVPPEECVGASVLYLFRDEGLGGTNFFVPRRTAFETDVLVHESGTLAPEAFARKYGIEPGYLNESNAWFERVLSVPPRWNRAIFYDGSLFHCSHIPAPERLDEDPRRGRLTLNGFFTCRRRAQ
jgi:hypothetical protein